MKVTLLQQDFISPLQAVARSIGIRTTLPVLANILIATDSNKLKLASTNLEIGVIKMVNAKIEVPGEITIPAKTLLEVISSLPAQEITLESNGDLLKISSKAFEINLNGISAVEFPAIPLSSDKSFKVKGEILKESIPQISFAAASDEGRPVLTGILTQISKSNLELVATDGFRLSHKKVSLENKDVDLFKFLIPRRTLEEIVRLIGEDLAKDESVEISISENQNQIIFKVGQTQLSSRLIEGNFPSWEKIVPSQFENVVVVEREELTKALKLAAVFSRSEANIVKMEISTNKLTISSEAKEIGAQKTEVIAEVGEKEMVIAFNTKYLQDVLNAIPGEKIKFEFSGSLSATLIKPLNNEELEYVIMPIKVS